jgi:hypothetical protein
MLSLIAKAFGRRAVEAPPADPDPPDPALPAMATAHEAVKSLIDTRDSARIADQLAECALPRAERERLAAVIKRLPEAEREPVLKALDVASEARKASDRILLSELGHSMDVPGGGPLERAQALAAASASVLRKSGEPPLTAEQSFSRLLKSTPGLYAELRRERRKQRGEPC